MGTPDGLDKLYNMAKKTIRSNDRADPEKLKAAVRKVRAEYGDTQQEFAHRLHAAIRSVARYETDRPPGGTVLIKLLRLARLKRLEVVSNAFQEALGAELADPELLRLLAKSIEQSLPSGFEKPARTASSQIGLDLGRLDPQDDEERALKAALAIMRTSSPADRQLFIESLKNIGTFKSLLRKAALMLDLEQKLTAEVGFKAEEAQEK